MSYTMWPKLLVLVLLIYLCIGNDVPWWKNAVYYRILIDSFKDSNGDGLGDIKGAIKQISYVRAVGADAVIISSLADTSLDCSKPGILDHTQIDQRYGNLDDFVALLDKTKKIELRLVISINLQSVSQASEWFISSEKRVAGFEDWFLWKDGKVDEPPPVEHGTEWKWNQGRDAFFAVANKEAVLNLCSDGVKAALSNAQCAWIRRGVSGVLLNPDFLFDESCGEMLLRKLSSDVISCARAANLDAPLVLVESSLSANKAAMYYSDGGTGANSVLSRALTSNKRVAAELALDFYDSLLNSPDDLSPTWITSAPTESRIATRYGNDMIDAVMLLILTLPGAVIIQQGDELGIVDTVLEWSTQTDKCWPSPAVPAAAPFPWDDSINAGFTTSEPWLPLPPNYRYANAKSEFANDLSHVGVVRIAAAMRKSPAMGPHAEVKRLGNAVAILRWGPTGSLLVISNVGKKQTEVELSKIPGLPSQMTVAASSSGSSLSVETHLNLEKSLKLTPGETVLLAGAPRHCGGPGPVDKIANKLNEGWQKINKYFSNL